MIKHKVKSEGGWCCWVGGFRSVSNEGPMQREAKPWERSGKEVGKKQRPQERKH